ncbi:hypothetical protein MD484_g465, partial [Candolleomyces efflorescens]
MVVATLGGDAMATLLLHSSPNAFHNSPTISSLHLPIRPITRQGAIDQVNKWITSPRPSPFQDIGVRTAARSTPIHWLSGTPGSGKSTIQLQLSNCCQQENRLLASFVFSANMIATHESQKRFVPSLAYQLAYNVPGLHRFISAAIENDPEIFCKPPVQQMISLVFHPLENCLKNSTGWTFWRRAFKASLFPRDKLLAISDTSLQLEESTAFRKLYGEWWNRNIIVVDALDECVGPREQQAVARLMFWASRHSAKFPLRFIISAPSEHKIIRNLFRECRGGMLSYTRLNDSVTRSHVRVYLEAEFARIRESRKTDQILWEEGWPGRKTVDRIVSVGGSLFIYASVIISFVNNGTGDPIELLDLLLSSLPDRARPTNGGASVTYTQFAGLDALYMFILHYHRPANRPDAIQEDGVFSLRKRILHAIMFSGRDFRSLTELDGYLTLQPGFAEVALRDLSPIIFIPPLASPFSGSRATPSDSVWKKIWFRHKSVWDFLVTKERSGDFYQSVPEAQITRIQKLEAAVGMENVPDSKFWAYVE